MLIIRKKGKQNYKILLRQILYLNKKGYRVKDIRKTLKISNPKKLVLSVGVS